MIFRALLLRWHNLYGDMLQGVVIWLRYSKPSLTPRSLRTDSSRFFFRACLEHVISLGRQFTLSGNTNKSILAVTLPSCFYSRRASVVPDAMGYWKIPFSVPSHFRGIFCDAVSRQTPNPSSRAVALELTRPLTGVSTRSLLAGEGRSTGA